MNTTSNQTMNTNETYNGWKNYETWNVALWMGNDEFWYGVARECETYQDFVREMLHSGVEATPDGVDLDDTKLDGIRLCEMLQEDF